MGTDLDSSDKDFSNAIIMYPTAQLHIAATIHKLFILLF